MIHNKNLKVVNPMEFFCMNVIHTEIPDVLIIEPKVFGDERGFFFESFNQKVWEEKTGLRTVFVQDNHSRSSKNVLRGLHYQIQQPQGKLVRVISGEVFDVAVDIRKQFTDIRQMGRSASVGRKQAAALGAGRFCPRVSRFIRGGRVPLQDN